MFGLVYKVTNKLSGKAYIGLTTQSLRKRWNAHVAQSPKCRWPVHRAIMKYGRDAFEVAVLERCADRASLDAAERRWIEREGTMQPNGYNLTAGGGGISGFKMPEEACRKLGERQRGREVSAETRAKIAAAKQGKRQSAETIEKRIAPLRGRQRDQETRRKISRAHTGKTLSPEHIAKRTAARQGWQLPQSAKDAISRPVLAEGQEFPSIKDAAEAIGISAAAVRYRVEKGVEGYALAAPVRQRQKRSAEQIERLRLVRGRPVMAAGIVFPSMTAAAAHLGVARNAVAQRIKYGWEGYARVA